MNFGRNYTVRPVQMHFICSSCYSVAKSRIHHKLGCQIRGSTLLQTLMHLSVFAEVRMLLRHKPLLLSM